MRMMLCVLINFLLLTISCLAQEDIIHSDVPLWGYDEESVWPKHFYEEDSFGCAHALRPGDWRFVEPETEERDGYDSWYRLANYGAFHCFLLATQSREQGNLNQGNVKHSYLIDLGVTEQSGLQLGLWALQLGARPGSDYLLMTSQVDGNTISQFQVLQVHCPEPNIRTGPNMDILVTRYCAINSKAELLTLAQEMAKLPPRGTLTYSDPIVGSE